MKFEKFEFLKEKYGHCASWAIWKEVGETPKSNAGDLNILDPKINKNLFSQLRPNVVLVGLNLSRNDGERIPFANFHSSNSYATDFKIRFALSDTKLWGGYMTDIIKEHEELHSQSVVRYLKKNPNVEKQNIEIFLEELKDIGTENPTIIAFGNAAYSILTRHLKDEYKILKVYHYAYRISKEKYKAHVKSVVLEGSLR
ncbi:MAG: hypothetical protein P8L36_10115 [SAR324 cluster bacterium]|nr:hypothetical protein [SAR324 cluster bacterium]